MNPGARQKRTLGHLTKGNAKSGGGQGERCGAPENSAQGLHKFAIDHRRRRGHIDRSAHPVLGQEMKDDANHVVDGNPAHPLSATSLASAQPQTEWGQELSKCTSMAAENHSKSGMDHPDSRLSRRLRCSLPLQTDPHQEIVTRISRRTRFRQNLIAPVAINPDCRRREHYPGWRVEPGERLRKDPGPVLSAFYDLSFRPLGPPLADILSGQVNDPVDRLQAAQFESATSGIPRDRSRAHRSASQPSHPVALPGESGEEGRPDQPSPSAHQQMKS